MQLSDRKLQLSATANFLTHDAAASTCLLPVGGVDGEPQTGLQLEAVVWQAVSAALRQRRINDLRIGA